MMFVSIVKTFFASVQMRISMLASIVVILTTSISAVLRGALQTVEKASSMMLSCKSAKSAIRFAISAKTRLSMNA